MAKLKLHVLDVTTISLMPNLFTSPSRPNRITVDIESTASATIYLLESVLAFETQPIATEAARYPSTPLACSSTSLTILPSWHPEHPYPPPSIMSTSSTFPAPNLPPLPYTNLTTATTHPRPQRNVYSAASKKSRWSHSAWRWPSVHY